MNDILDFLIRYGTLVLFCVVFLEQLGLPLPSPPFLLAAGALAGRGEMSGLIALTVTSLASMMADSIWYFLGRSRGGSILKLLCRISLEPDSCVRRTENVFVRHGMRGLLTAKFVPGLGTVMPPLAGVFRVKFGRFLVFDALGSVLYLASFLALGFCFSNQLQHVLDALSRLGRGAFVLLVALLAAYIAFKYLQRQRALCQMRMARITPEELRQRQEAGEEIFVVDVRSEAAVQSDPFLIPGARHLHVDKVDDWHHEIPRDREVVLYCSCPNEAGAAQTALILFRRGVTRIRPLLGGIDAWRERNYPLTQLQQAEATMEVVKTNE